jgi:hypothetical protein
MLLSISLTLAVVHALSYVEGRHRWGIEPLLLLLTARGLFVLANALAGERQPVRQWLARRGASGARSA